MKDAEYYARVARKTYRRGVYAWHADLKKGKAPERGWDDPAEYIIKAIAKALSEERNFGRIEGATR
jgi:hypothetical protein